MTGKDKTVVLFKLEKTTPGAVRYQEIDSGGAPLKTSDPGCHIGSLYVRKSALGGTVPEKLKVEISAA